MVESSVYKVHFVLADGTIVQCDKEHALKMGLAKGSIEEDPECEDHEDDGEEERRWDVPV
jgi:hypothetical protein